METAFIEDGAAWVSVTSVPETDAVRIGYVFVPPGQRRAGIGKELLRKSIDVAREKSASRIIAEITSKEALRAMVGVFGVEAVQIEREGTFADERPFDNARAYLDYSLDQ